MKKTIFSSYIADFLIFFFPVVFFSILYFKFQYSVMFVNLLLLIVYFVDTGHVYTTFLESLVDKDERKNPKVWGCILFSFFINFIIWNISHQLFFAYLFYFTIFHHMKQGFGIIQLYEKRRTLKNYYYFLVLLPIICFHFLTPSNSSFQMDQKLFAPMMINNFLDDYIFYINIFYLFLLSGFIYLALKNKLQILTIIYSLFYVFLYSISFLFLKDAVYSFVILVVSHGIPYIFLISKRIKLTHSVNLLKKYSMFFVIIAVLVGGLIEYFDAEMTYSMNNFWKNIFYPMFFTPTISHFIIDGIIWKKDHPKFYFFLKKNI